MSERPETLSSGVVTGALDCYQRPRRLKVSRIFAIPGNQAPLIYGMRFRIASFRCAPFIVDVKESEWTDPVSVMETHSSVSLPSKSRGPKISGNKDGGRDFEGWDL